MKITIFLAVLFTLFLVAPRAWADVYVFPLNDGSPGFAQPYYQQQNRVQLTQQPQPYHPAPACVCQPSQAQQPYTQQAYAQQTYAQQAAVRQPPAPPLTVVYGSMPAQQVIAREDRTIYFGFGKSGLNNEAKAKLKSIAAKISSGNNVISSHIVGYTDRIGSTRYNETLSRRRAEHVQTYLLNSGIIMSSNLDTRWVGKTQASARCSKHLPHKKLIACLQSDRKVEVNINYRTPYLQPQPQYAPQPQPQLQPLY